MKKVLFIGNHLSSSKGTKSASENVAELLSDSFEIKLSSSKENKFLRLFEIAKDSFFCDYELMHIDIYSGNALIYAKLATFIAKIKNKKIIMNLHGGRLSKFHESFPKKLNFLKMANKIISPSNYLINYFNNKNYNVEYLANYINQDKFPYNREKTLNHSLLWVRAFSDIYQPELAVKIVHELSNEFSDIHLTMIGPDKGLQKITERLIKELKLEDKISIMGKISNNELYKYYQSNHVYINTTKYESFGLAVLEAASCGIPIVSTNVGEIPFIWIEDKEILLCNSNEKKFKNNIKKIFKSKNIAKQLSLNAKIKADTFNEKNVKKQWKKIFNEFI